MAMAMDEYLTPTQMCDYESDTIRDLSQELRSPSGDDRETARRIFDFVRNSILFEVRPLTERASQTLSLGRGHCTHKANVQVALCRANKIPAGYGVQVVKTEMLEPFMTAEALAILGEPIVHLVTKVHLDGRWITTDTIFDQSLLDIQPVSFAPPATWDGFEDVLLDDSVRISELIKLLPVLDFGPGSPILTPEQIEETARVFSLENLPTLNVRLEEFRCG